jgi:uncharacterized membrane protein
MSRAAPTERLDRQLPTVIIVLIACFVMLMGGFLLKNQCTSVFSPQTPTAPEVNAFSLGHQYSRLCYNDIQPLYGIRAVADNTFPYIHGEFTADHQLIDGAVEYPVLTGLFLWFTGLFASNASDFLVWNVVFLAPFGLISAYFLARLAGWRALMWAASPAVIWYAFHNWDLLVVAAVVAGLWSWHREKHVAAAIWFGVGCALKMYPIMFVVPLALERWYAGKRSDATKVFLAGAGSALAINLPFILITFDGWWGTYAFHKVRGPNFDSIWGLLGDGGTSSLFTMPTLNLTVAALTILWFALAVGAGMWRAHREGVFPFVQVAGAMLIAFLLWNKVHSPQYTLWLLPFFVVLRVHVAWWIAYGIVDTIAYFGIFKWFYDIVYQQEYFATPAKNAMVGAVWARAALLFALFVVFLLSKRADPPEEELALSHPPPSLEPVGDPA